MVASLCPLVSDRQPRGAQCEESFSAQPCSDGSADSLDPRAGLPVCEEGAAELP